MKDGTEIGYNEGDDEDDCGGSEGGSEEGDEVEWLISSCLGVLSNRFMGIGDCRVTLSTVNVIK